MKVEVSIGEAIDKLSILELKQRIIQDGAKLAEIQKEINALDECKKYKNDYYKILMYVNEKVWNLTDRVKSISAAASNENAVEFATISNEIFEFNQKRFRIKNIFNLSQNSSIKEQKSYNYKNACIILQSAAQIYKKIPEIAFLTIEYDFLFFYVDGGDNDAPSSVEDILKKTHPIASNSGIIKISAASTGETDPVAETIDLSKFCLSDDLYSIFEPSPLSYRTCGMFGDFIHQLSVINEKYLETGRKGIIYLHDGGHPFRNGVEATYNDTRDVISKQPYVKDYKIYSGEHIDICLSAWRNHLSHDSWNDIYKRTYGIEWGQSSWLNIPYDEKWRDKIIINNPHYRPIVNFSIQDATILDNFCKSAAAQLVFLSYSEKDYNDFKNRYNSADLNIEYYCPSSFLDMCTAIRSCNLFIGGMSGALTIAHACKTPRMVLLYGEHSADIHELKMASMWNNVFFNIREFIERSRSDKLLQSLKEKDDYIQTLERKIAQLNKKS